MGRIAQAAPPPTPTRPDLDRIWPYVPGRHRDEIVREYGVTDVLKLASNESAIGPSPRAMEVLAGLAPRLHMYPDSQAIALREAVAALHGLTIDHVIVGNGSVECIDLVARVFLRPGDEALVGFPSFPRFTIACQVVGVEPTVVPHRDWVFDLDRVLNAVTDRTRVVFIDNPCNPTGTHIPPGEVARFLDALPEEILVVLDRAYYEFVPPDKRFAEDVERIRSGANLVTLRTFSKAHGLAGLRVGYALARPEHAAAMNHLREAFNASVVAQASAVAALGDEDHIAEAVAVTENERRWLAPQLERLGFRVVPSQTNFLFVDLGAVAGAVNQQLLERGIIIRPMVAPTIQTWARISIPRREGGERLVAALEEILR